MERKEADIIIGTKITYSEDNCRYVLLRDHETGKIQRCGVYHKDAPLLAPEITVDPYKPDFIWDFAKVMMLNDEDLDTLMKNICELRSFIEKIKDIEK